MTSPDYTLALARHMRALDQYTVTHGGIELPSLMWNASLSVYEAALSRGMLSGISRVAILCGLGGNGGDGYALALILKRSLGVSPVIVRCFKGEPKNNATLFYMQQALTAGLEIVPPDESAEQYISSAQIIFDAVFGTGFEGILPEEILRLFSYANRSSARRVSIDIPSGVNSDDGRADPTSFKADLTVTFACRKPGLVSYPGCAYAGEVAVTDIGIPPEAFDGIKINDIYVTPHYMQNKLPLRTADSHKGTYGKLLCFTGSANMTGAAVLSAKAALRTGVGLCVAACPRPILPILQSHLLEPVFLPLDGASPALELSGVSAVLAGCGCGKSLLLRQFLERCRQYPLILDADALNLLADEPELLKMLCSSGECVLTPHPAEMARLCHTDVATVQSDRINIARRIATQYGCTVLLKGARSVTASKDGRIFVNSTGNPGMAKGGSGDVLAGIVASLAAQGIAPLDAAVWGAYLHGLAGDICADELGEYGMLPSNMIDRIPTAIKSTIRANLHCG